MADIDDIDEGMAEDELDRIFNSGILDYYQAQGVMHKASNRRVGCGWNGKEIIIGRDCHPEVLLHELAYCLVEVTPVKKQNRPIFLLHLFEMNELTDEMSEEEHEAFVETMQRGIPEDILEQDARITLLAITFGRSLGFDTLTQMEELLQIEDPLRYPYDPNSPLDEHSPFLVYENRKSRKRILDAFRWLETNHFFKTPFTERASQEIKFMLTRMFGMRNLEKWDHVNRISPAAYIDGTYYRLSSHPQVQAQEEEFMSEMPESEYNSLRAEKFFIPRVTEEEGNFFVYFTPIRKGKRVLELDEPIVTEDGESEFETEEEAHQYLLENLHLLPSNDLADYTIVSEQGFADRTDFDDEEDEELD